MNKCVAIVLLGLAGFLSSCNILKRPNSKNVTIDTANAAPIDTFGLAPVPPPLPADTATAIATSEPSAISAEKQQLIDQLLPLWNSSAEYKTFKGKAKMHYRGGGMDQDFTANIRIAKDSLVWIHITAGMGIVNVARILITPDSFQLLNYLQKSALSMPISEVEKLLPVSVDFSVVQNLIIGEVLSHKGRPTDATDLGGMWGLVITDTGVSQQLNFSKADSTMKTLQVLSADQDGFAGMIQYGNYSIINGRKFSISRAINFTAREQPHYFDMNFNNASFDEEMDYPFAIPDSYSLNKQ